MVKGDGRCPWCGDDPVYIAYHDREWGVPVADEDALFERLCLEGMQAGLSWLTVLRKRSHMRKVFHGFDPLMLARSGSDDLKRWLGDPGLIRHRGKLEALVSNARLVADEPGALPTLLWSYVDGRPRQNAPDKLSSVPVTTAEAQRMAKDLKRRGFRFVGPRICYALMQSAGLVNDHLVGCPARLSCARIAASWTL